MYFFLFFLYKSVFDQISTKFRRNSTNFRPIVVVDKTSQSAKRRIDQMSHSTKRRFDQMVFDQMSWIPNVARTCDPTPLLLFVAIKYV